MIVEFICLSSQSFEGWEEFQQFLYVVRSVLAFCPMCEIMKYMIECSILLFIGLFQKFTCLILFFSFQGLLSTTYIIDIVYRVENGQEQQKSIFLKVPLNGKAFRSFREVICFTT